MNLKKHCALLVLLTSIITCQARAQDMAELMCGSYVMAIGNISYIFRTNGYPIGEAEKKIYEQNIDDSNARIWLRKVLIPEMYRDPEKTMRSVNDGTMAKRCAKAIRGY
jgi:hypothetical protein